MLRDAALKVQKNAYAPYSKFQVGVAIKSENGHIFYIAYVSEQNLENDATKERPKHPEIKNLFSHFENGKFVPLTRAVN